jgi:hypothetical protein
VKWVTSKGIKISRAATAWLIRRFIDRDAELLFVPSADVLATAEREGAVGFHAAGTSYPPVGPDGQSSFEALVAAYCSENEALREMAQIVGHADRPGRANAPPEAAGLRCISAAFPLIARDDVETVERSQFMYDALYAALEERVRARLKK